MELLIALLFLITLYHHREMLLSVYVDYVSFHIAEWIYLFWLFWVGSLGFSVFDHII